MEKIQLRHPEGKKGISMDKVKYDTLKMSFIECLGIRKSASLDELLSDVTADLKNKGIKIQGVLQWNLFWGTLDMEANNALKKDKKVSPYMYSL
jgi:hypothetical protein